MGDLGFNPNKFLKGSEESKEYNIGNGMSVIPATPKKKKEMLSPKESAQLEAQQKQTTTTPAVQPTQPTTTGIDFIQSNTPYMEAYRETNTQLDNSINELDMLASGLFGELTSVKNTKTLKNKYNYINDMSETLATIINAKLSAIKEKNKVINDTNTMELRRIKELNSSANEEDDNQRIMNLYDAFINTPVGTNYGQSVLGPSFMDMTVASNNQTLAPTPVGTISEQQQLSSWQSNLSPSENRMLLDAQGQIETVVMYDNASGNRWYEVIDKQTGQPVPNVDKPSDVGIYELDINVRGGFAKDSNRNTTYRLIVLNGENDNIMEY